MPTFGGSSNIGLFVPTTNIWDIAELYKIDVQSPEFKELIVRLYQNINAISIALNLKNSGYYTLEEFLTGQVFFPNPELTSATEQRPTYRQVYRTVVMFGALPDNTIKSVAHGIDFTSTYSLTSLMCVATDPTDILYIPIPYASSTTSNIIEINVDAMDINITTNSVRHNFSICLVTLEYIKQ